VESKEGPKGFSCSFFFFADSVTSSAAKTGKAIAFVAVFLFSNLEAFVFQFFYYIL
jgi:hypothetical protein